MSDPFESPTDDILAAILSERKQLDVEMARRYPRLWARSGIFTETGQPLDFSDRPWLKDIWDDMHRRIVVQKSAQVGITTWAGVRAFHLAGVNGKTVIFTLPTEDDRSDFVGGRLDRMIDYSPLLQRLVGRGAKRADRRTADNTDVKHVGRGTIYFRGTQTEHAALSVPAHALFHDEVDRSQPEMLEMYEHRLDALPAAERQVFLISTPTVAGYGISAEYEASDARQWLVRCTHPGCGWQGPLDYWEHTGGSLDYLRCTGCGSKLDPRIGEWVASHPERSSNFHGYQISRLFMAVPDQPEVLESLHANRQEARYIRHFENMYLGIPSSEGTDRITRAQILKSCFVETYGIMQAPEPGGGPYYMGVDQGDTLTVLIGRADPRRDGGRLRTVYLAQLRDPSRGLGAWEEVANLIEAFNVRMCVVDAQPNREVSESSTRLVKVLFIGYPNQAGIQSSHRGYDELSLLRFSRNFPTGQENLPWLSHLPLHKLPARLQ